jgi:hypothetical protein
MEPSFRLLTSECSAVNKVHANASSATVTMTSWAEFILVARTERVRGLPKSLPHAGE